MKKDNYEVDQDDFSVLLTKEQVDDINQNINTLKKQVISQIKIQKNELKTNLQISKKTYVKEILHLSKIIAELQTQNESIQPIQSKNTNLKNLLNQEKRKYIDALKDRDSQIESLKNKNQQLIKQNQVLLLQQNQMKSNIVQLEQKIKDVKFSQQQNSEVLKEILQKLQEQQDKNTFLHNKLQQLEHQSQKVQKDKDFKLKQLNQEVQKAKLRQNEFQKSVYKQIKVLFQKIQENLNSFQISTSSQKSTQESFKIFFYKIQQNSDQNYSITNEDLNRQVLNGLLKTLKGKFKAFTENSILKLKQNQVTLKKTLKQMHEIQISLRQKEILLKQRQLIFESTIKNLEKQKNLLDQKNKVLRTDIEKAIATIKRLHSLLSEKQIKSQKNL